MIKWSGKTPNKIPEFELNFSNACLASCLICSRNHGCGSKPFMDPDVFNELLSQMKDSDFNCIQTSGNGECLLNPHYLDYLSLLKQNFPNKPRWCYDNYSMMIPEIADRIIREKLLDKVHVRIDSLIKWIFERNSNLNQDTVFKNVQYFLERNTEIPVTILYNNINDYYSKCRKILDKRPSRDYFTDEELAQVPDEEAAIFEYFKPMTRGPLSVCRIGHSLWGERDRCRKDGEYPCPKWEVIQGITWISPNGNVQACCYDDAQDAFTVGNIMDTHILDIFYGPKRMEILSNIKKRAYKDYPCTNPRCCEFT